MLLLYGRDKHLCSMKCTEDGCLAFYVDETTKECKLGAIEDGYLRSDGGIKAYMKIDDKGNPLTTGKEPTGPDHDCELFEGYNLCAPLPANCGATNAGSVNNYTENGLSLLKSCQLYCYRRPAPYFTYSEGNKRCYCKSSKGRMASLRGMVSGQTSC